MTRFFFVLFSFTSLLFSFPSWALDLSAYAGKVVLVVNIATRCGYTGQLDGLEKLHKRYKKQGLVVLGVPSNDFGSQTPEDNSEVKKFCKLNYGVSFPMTDKTIVAGPQRDVLFKTLTRQNGIETEIKWNFEKFLVGRNGNLIERFSSDTEPSDSKLVSKLELALSEQVRFQNKK